MIDPKPGQVLLFQNKYMHTHWWVIEIITQQEAKKRQLEDGMKKLMHNKTEQDNPDTIYYVYHAPHGTHVNYYYSARKKEIDGWERLATNNKIEVFENTPVKDVLEIVRAMEKIM